MSRTTQYIRGKQRERGSETRQFMTDGFDRWAESETPASFNSMEKIPTELTKGTMARGVRYGQKLDGMVGSARGRKGKRGGALFDDVMTGWSRITNEFTNPDSYLQQGVGQVTNEFTNPESLLRGEYLGKLGNEFTDKDSLLRAQYLGQAADGVAKAAPIIDMLGEQMGLGKGVGKTMAEVLKAGQEVNKAAKAVGYGKRGGAKGALDYVSEFVPESRDAISQAKSYSPLLKMLLKGQAPQYSSQIDQGAKMLGLGRKVGGKKGGFWGSMFPGMGMAQQLAPQPIYTGEYIPPRSQADIAFSEEIQKMLAQQGRPQEIKTRGGRKSARAEVVKRVMAERGCSLPMASSIVKREGLY